MAGAGRGLFGSSVGKKALMAATGIVLFGFVVGHLVGNLKLYGGRYGDGPHAGEYKLDVYAEGLRELGKPFLGHGQAIWIFRIALLAAVGVHIWAAWETTRQSWTARPAKYAKPATVEATYAARTMRWGGLIVLFYVLYHLADLTFGWANPAFVPGRVRDNLVASFSQPLVAGFYIVATVALGFHLRHGLWSMFQSLGWSNPRFDAWRQRFAIACALILTAGNLSFPIAVLAGVVP
jgi:succinate dehydrogenase / fumarate reductase cytochrome b subunit